MKVLKWIGVGFVVLVVIGALIGDSEEEKGSDDEPAAAQVAEEVPSKDEPEETPEPTPEPKPEIDVDITSPSTVHSDDVTLRGTVSIPGSKVRVKGQKGGTLKARVKGRRWAADVQILGVGNNDYRVTATKAGAVTGRTEHTVVRELSAAERAVIRQEKAERRANRRALEAAENYLSFSGFSKQGLYEQLSSDYGEGFTEAEAQYAVDHVDVDWNQEAVESARSYLEMSPMSRDALIEQLSSPAGEGFTYEQAVYAVNKVY